MYRYSFDSFTLCLEGYSRVNYRSDEYAVNSVGDDGARALAKALQTNCTLTSLDLGGMCSPVSSVDFRFVMLPCCFGMQLVVHSLILSVTAVVLSIMFLFFALFGPAIRTY